MDFEKTPTVLGEFDTKSKNDTLFVKYKIGYGYFEPDSLVLGFKSYKANIRINLNNYALGKTDVVVFRNTTKGHVQDSIGSHLNEFEGTAKIPQDGISNVLYYCVVSGYYTDDSLQVKSVIAYKYFPEFYVGLGMEIYFPSFGYFRTTFGNPFDKKGGFFGYGAEVEFILPKNKIVVSTSVSGLGGKFAFSDPIRLEYRYFTGTDNNYMPSFYSAAKLSKIKLRKDDQLYRKQNWGAEFGVASEGPFERLGYSYSTNVGGFHTAELFLAAISTNNMKFGTRYTFQKAGEIWMIRVAAHFQGIDIDSHGKGTFLSRRNSRPLPHKVLALVGVSPIILAGSVYKFFKNIFDQ